MKGVTVLVLAGVIGGVTVNYLHCEAQARHAQQRAVERVTEDDRHAVEMGEFEAGLLLADPRGQTGPELAVRCRRFVSLPHAGDTPQPTLVSYYARNQMQFSACQAAVLKRSP